MPIRPTRFKVPRVAQAARVVDKRPSAAKRGYDYQHRQIASRQLKREPVCATPGCGAAATDVDHIKRICEGGLRRHVSNLQSLCHECHSRKTQREGARP